MFFRCAKKPALTRHRPSPAPSSVANPWFFCCSTSLYDEMSKKCGRNEGKETEKGRCWFFRQSALILVSVLLSRCCCALHYLTTKRWVEAASGDDLLQTLKRLGFLVLFSKVEKITGCYSTVPSCVEAVSAVGGHHVYPVFGIDSVRGEGCTSLKAEPSGAVLGEGYKTAHRGCDSAVPPFFHCPVVSW